MSINEKLLLMLCHLTLFINSCNYSDATSVTNTEYFDKISSKKISDAKSHLFIQDSILKHHFDNSNYQEYIKLSDTILSCYKTLNIDNKAFNSDYLYLIGKLYLNQTINIPFDLYYDSLTSKYKYEAKYSSLLDSSYFYLSSAVNINPKNLFAINSLLKLCYFDHQRQLYYTGYKFNNKRYDLNFNQILNLFANKKISDNVEDSEVYSQIIELTIIEILTNINENYFLDPNDINRVNLFHVLGDLIDIAKTSTIFGQYISSSYFDKTLLKVKKPIAIARKRFLEIEKEQKEKLAKENYYKTLANLNYSHKYVLVKNNIENGSIVNALVELYGGDSFTWIATEALSGFKQSFHGSYYRNGDKIVTKNASNNFPNKVFTIILKKDNQIWLQLDNGETYVQDDDLYYIKNGISTPRERILMERNN
jgi:hypothetical protein